MLSNLKRFVVTFPGIFAVFGLFTLFPGCAEHSDVGSVKPVSSSGNNSASTGTLQLLLTDFPMDGVDAVNVTISRIEVHHTGSGWLLFSNIQQNFDLLTLQDVTVSLGLKQLPVGKYTQIRLVVREGNIVVDGEEQDLLCPSCMQTGIKLIHPFSISPDMVTTLTIDFDAAESIHHAAGRYILRPVITIFATSKPDDTPPTISVSNTEVASAMGTILLSDEEVVTLVGFVTDNRLVVSFTITLNGVDVFTPTLGPGGSFSQEILLNTSQTQIFTPNSVDLVAIDGAGNTTSLVLEVRFVAPAVPGELLIRFNADTSPSERAQVLNSISGTLVDRIARNLFLVRIPDCDSVEDAIITLNPPNFSVHLAMPNALMLAAGAPNDAMFGAMWHLDDGTPSGPNDADIDAPDAWDIGVGSTDIIVAVLDTGVQYDHEDLIDPNADTDCNGVGDAGLIDNIWLNEAECCLVPPCASLCLPKLPVGDPNACPIADLNGDGCPGICGFDDDGDGLSDFADPDVQRVFTNGIDDDADGIIDEQGPGGVNCSNIVSIPPGTPGDQDCDGVANDDDENGYADDCRGWDFSNRHAGYPNDNDPNDLWGHGTHVAGTIGAIGNNCIGVTGVNQRIRIMPIKVMRNQILDLAGALSAFAYAASNGAMVTNSSWCRRCVPAGLQSNRCPWGNALSTADAAEVFTALMKETNSFQVLHVFAAGNFYEDLDTTPNFYYVQQAQIPNKLLVAASDDNDQLATAATPGFQFGSNFGENSVAVAAPGASICSTVPNDGYDCTYSGTSMAAPHVAGLAGLILSTNPELIGDPTRLIRHILNTVESGLDLGTDNALDGLVSTAGRINAANAMGAVLPPPTLFVDDTFGNIPAGFALTSYDVELVDVDGDGDLDFLDFPCHRLDLSDQIRLMINDGTGTFTDVTAAKWPAELTSQCGATVGDVDGDGDKDVVVGGFSNYNVSLREVGLFLNDGSGIFVRDTTGKIPLDTFNTRDVDLCDVDGDGDLDIFASNAGSAPTDRIFINDGAGTFTDETSTRLATVDTGGSTHNSSCEELTKTLDDICVDENPLICPLCANPGLSVGYLVANGLGVGLIFTYSCCTPPTTHVTV